MILVNATVKNPKALARKRRKADYLREKFNGYVYFFNLVGSKLYKIGMSKNPGFRLYDAIVPHQQFEIVHEIPTNWMPWLESYFHHLYESKHSDGEWFELDDSDIEYIKSIEYGHYDLDKFFDFYKVSRPPATLRETK